MQVILLEKIANLGNLGDIVKVKQGYGRNYLIPQRKARTATPAAIAEFEARRAELEAAAAAKLADAQQMAQKMEGLQLAMTQRAGVDGRLFGSVTNHDLAVALAKQGFDVPKSALRMPNGPIKTTGEHSVEVALHTEVVVPVTVQITGEQI